MSPRAKRNLPAKPRAEHPSDATLRAYAKAASDRTVTTHLADCEACAADVRLLRAWSTELLADGGDCPDGETLVAFAMGRADEAQRPVLERHLSSCQTCAIECEAVTRAETVHRALPGPEAPWEQLFRRISEELRALVTFVMPAPLTLATRSGKTAKSGLELGLEAYTAARYESAIEHFAAALARGDRSRELPFFLGVSLLQVGDAEGAAVALEQAVRKSPRLGDYRWYQALAELAAAREGQAVRAFRKAAVLPGRYRAAASVAVKQLTRQG